MPDATATAPTGEDLPHTHGQALARLRCALDWESGVARHTDCLVLPRLDLWRDLLPEAIAAAVIDQPVGHRATATLPAGALTDPWQAAGQFAVPAARFTGHFGGVGPIAPRSGRFYPRAILAGLPGVFSQDQRPLRVLAADPAQLRVDLNHPLAHQALGLTTHIEAAWQPSGAQRGGRCQEVAELLAANGPGMQARAGDAATDFWADEPFARADPREDARFYAEPRLVPHLDRCAQAELATLYGRLLPGGGRILDLMASWQSHLPETLAPRALVGLGMNQAELAANPALSDALVHDLNAVPDLPWPAGSFDAVVCSLSVEYLTDPVAVFRAVARVLRPGGRFVLTFSNRWFPPKAIAIWPQLHEFERMGLMLEVFLAAGGFADLATFSLRGLPRPVDDPYAAHHANADPLYAVWGDTPPATAEG